MLVSVIIAAYNCASTVEAAVLSTSQQQIPELEIIVVDDASTDSTVTVVQALKVKQLRLIRRECNGGPSLARNNGIAAASGQLIAFLDADDEWIDGGLLKLYRALMESPETDIVQGQFLDRWPDGREDDARFSHRITGVLYRSPVFEQLGGFNESLRKGEDFDLWVGIRNQGFRLERVSVPVSIYTRRPLVDREAHKEYYARVAETLKRHLDKSRALES